MVVYKPHNGKDGKMNDTIIAVDLAKRVFQLHATTLTGEVKFRRKLMRDQFRKFMAEQAGSLVVLEACGSANYWAREMKKLGHEVNVCNQGGLNPSP